MFAPSRDWLYVTWSAQLTLVEQPQWKGRAVLIVILWAIWCRVSYLRWASWFLSLARSRKIDRVTEYPCIWFIEFREVPEKSHWEFQKEPEKICLEMSMNGAWSLCRGSWLLSFAGRREMEIPSVGEVLVSWCFRRYSDEVLKKSPNNQQLRHIRRDGITIKYGGSPSLRGYEGWRAGQ